ncbi:hypothetical protein [Paenibacillus terrae]|uniref:Uncharacterized protein n=1 Tax=Paenibacillus terrae TaxID=159743 RepID=A0A0D7WV76_9BACL|nr:hypothetical protein [Paenibacillus terrae]KJD42623.1 hypothetical protein QD47_27220 [Paenibacillus terrae]
MSVDNFKDKGEAWAFPVSELRTLMMRMLYDANFREPIRKKRIKELDTINPFTGRHHNALEQLEIFNETDELQDTVYDSLCIGGFPANPDLKLGSFSLQARIFLLKNALFFQEKAGLEFVTGDDINYIKAVWKEELGWIDNESDVQLEYIPYLGALVLDRNYNLNHRETTIPNLVIDPRYYARETTRYSLEENIEGLNILNYSPSADYHFIYYITTDFGGGEYEIWETFENAKRNMGFAVPFYWHPVAASGEKGSKVYWNNVTVVVCRPEIRSLKDARAFVEDYIAAGSKTAKPGIADRENIYWRLIKNKSKNAARQLILSVGDQPNHIPLSIKAYYNLSDEVIILASKIIKSKGSSTLYETNPESVREECLKSNVWEKVFRILMSECSTTYSGQKFLLDKGFHPLVVPETIKEKFVLSDSELYWNYQMKKYGEQEVINILAILNSHLHFELPSGLSRMEKDRILKAKE